MTGPLSRKKINGQNLIEKSEKLGINFTRLSEHIFELHIRFPNHHDLETNIILAEKDASLTR